MRADWRALWAGWCRVAHRIGEAQSRLLLFLVYLLVVAPVGVCLRLLSDPLRRRRPAKTNWSPRTDPPATLEEGRRQ